MKNSLWLVLLIVILGLGNFQLPNFNVAEAHDLLRAEGYVAYVVNAVPPRVPTPTPQCSCNGTGKVKTPEGFTINCPCDNCQCKKPQGDVQQLDKQIYYFGAEWCPPCKIFKTYEFPKLTQLGFDIGIEDWNMIRVIDVDTQSRLYQKYGGGRPLPLIILIKDGKEVSYINNSRFAATAESVKSLWMQK